MHDLFPVFSWLASGGKCRYCKTALSVRYPLIEISTAIVCLFLYGRFGFSPEAFVSFLLAPLLVSMIEIDFRHKIIPDEINLAIAGAGLLALFFKEGIFLENGIDALWGVLLYGAASWTLRFLFMKIMNKEALGLGDVKFFASIGLWLGSGLEIFTFFLFFSGVFGIVLGLFWKKISGEREFPFGPALAGAFLISEIYGNEILAPLL